MNLIITMAGRYSRFIEEGYRLPKYLLPWGDHPILKVIISKLNSNNSFKNVYFIANKRDEVYMPHVKKIIRSFGIPLDNLFLISDTSGQAETASKAISLICKKFTSLEGGVVFHNIDTILFNRDIDEISNALRDSDGYIDIFKSSNHNYSYVLIENDIVRSIAEKIVISNNASSGMYAFKNIDIFNQYYSQEMLYISDIYKGMIEDGASIVAGCVYSEDETLVLGTPSEYLAKAYILNN